MEVAGPVPDMLVTQALGDQDFDRLADQLRSLGHTASHCPRCKQSIRWFDNLPIVGWLKLGGRCRKCRGRISIRYPLVELLTATLFVVVYWHQIPGELSATISQSVVMAEGRTEAPVRPEGKAKSSWATS